MVGPEERFGRLLSAPRGAVGAPEFLELRDVVGVLLAGEGIGAVRSKLRSALERERPDPSIAPR
jgi:hypothetical protein